MAKKYFVALILMATTSMALAVPQTIRFQGRLTNSNGQPIAGTPQVQFSLHQTPDTASEVWSTPDWMFVDSNDQGLFSTEIGPIPVTVFSTNDDLYLEIMVRGVTGTQTLRPRQKLSSVAFSFSSHHAETAGSAESIRDDSVTSPKILNGEVRSEDIGLGAVNSAHIEDGSVQLIDLGPGSVNSEKIQDGEVGSLDLAPNAVHSDNIEDNSIRDLDLAPDAVGTLELQNDSVTSEKLGLDAVKTENILNGEVQEGDIQDDAVSSAKLAPGSVNSEAISPEVALRFVPTGMIALFNGSCPSSWSRFSGLDNRFPMGGSTAGGTGGSDTHSHVIPPDGRHGHSATTNEANVVETRVEGNTGYHPSQLLSDYGTTHLRRYDRHNHPTSIASSPQHSHTGSTANHSGRPPYRTMVFCQKN